MTKNKSVDLWHLSKAEIIYATIFSFILPLINVLNLGFQPKFLALSFVYNVQYVTQSFVLYYILLHMFSHHAILERSWKTAFLWHGTEKNKNRMLFSNAIILVFVLGIFFTIIPLSSISNDISYFSGLSSLFWTGIFVSLPINIILRKFFDYSWTNSIISSLITSPLYSLIIIGLQSARL